MDDDQLPPDYDALKRHLEAETSEELQRILYGVYHTQPSRRAPLPNDWRWENILHYYGNHNIWLIFALRDLGEKLPSKI